MSMNGHQLELENFLWTPEDMTHTAIQGIEVRHQNERQAAIIYKFKFNYKGKQHEVQVIAHSDVTSSEIEDRAGQAAADWKMSMDEREHKRPPTPDERKQIGKVMDDFLQHAKKRRESSSGRIYFPGVK